MAADSDSEILRKEFHAFWNAGLRGRDYLDQSAIVCFLDLDQEEVTLTRIFYRTPDDEGSERAEDLMIDWFYEEQLVQRADTIDIRLYMNYSPLRLTVDGLLTVFDNLKETGKEVKVMLKFVELYMAGEGEEDAEENRGGLRALQAYGVEVDIMKGRDWLFLVQTLTQRAGKKRQGESNSATRACLLRILKDPRDAQTGTESPEVTEAETMTDPPPPTPPPADPEEAKHSSSSSEDEDD